MTLIPELAPFYLFLVDFFIFSIIFISSIVILIPYPFFLSQICQARAWILSMGFTLAFGAMFSKVWRVHRFTTKAKTDPKVQKNNFYLI